MTDVMTAPTLSPASSGYAPVNGLQLYYEIHGEAQGDTPPLILLHGGFGTTGMFAGVLPRLAQNRQVIAVDLQAHGRTADIDRPLSFEALAGDLAALAGYLKLVQVDVMGYSFGGGAALQTAICHPEVVRRLVVVSFPVNSDAWYPEVRAGMAQMGPQAAEGMKSSPMYAAYAQVAPRVEDWPVLVTKLGQMMGLDYDWTAQAAALEMPVCIVVGDADLFGPQHAAEWFGLLGGGQKDPGWDGAALPATRLAVLPGTTHYDIFVSPLLAVVVTPFLDA
ncbi:alpha/beta hydrolase [Deinococcus rubellus]|uniref:Alpha/beta hydrolase n=1 Tax=Deinococcus rubellus TaxID=1889240 RepID=A0ABY5YE39_9DEIO|nr:alpha/beta hydrolase [Deinococcus rubellus]UWX63335.1 alpha/beta hydrolase [Deinococcus rubellus]